MNLVVDYGNTGAKVGFFDQHQMLEKKTINSLDSLRQFLESSDAENIIISSVSHPAEDLAKYAVRASRKFVLDHRLPLPVFNHYSTPETLGVDRIAGVCGALQLFPGSDTLVIDAGTCITYDLIDAERNYRGGAISPGYRMRFRAVHEFTARLPLVDGVEAPELVGDSTESSIQSGVFYGMLAEIEGTIARYGEKYKEMKIVLTGGDAGVFENKLKAPIFASPNLVLVGLNSILDHNVNRK